MSLFEDTAWDSKYGVLGFAFLTITGGFALALWGGFADLKLWWYAQAEPQVITAQKLAAEGPGNNVHVRLTDYVASKEGRGKGSVGYFRVVPKISTENEASLLLRTSGGDSMFGVHVPDDELQGLVYDGSGSLNADLCNAIKQLGPVKFDHLWIIDLDQQPPPWWQFLLKVGGGLLLVGIGAAVFTKSVKDE